ncbi:hypothetical protein COY28_00655 [Candidatus Woesearchaeota archaeon CG_4_10_14_0_2_um_filter_57_5]|nr:MAG: hypothetical protein AUJ68_03235 [Candidatus Woesearchaeota archaeon CG1_02_57_44]PIZ56837.1 MAG: hypothetical protein COY28_00655 [Candidatus Woesearchaeota archaeon CG_4_10_14_0_2_um_filter_57_5]
MDKGIRLILFTALVSGFSIFLNSWAVKGFDSSVFTFSKNLLVALLLSAVLLGIGMRDQLMRLKAGQWRQLMLIGLVGGSIPFLLFFKGLQMTTGSTAGFIHKTLFLFATLFAVLFLRERWDWRLGTGMALLLGGTYLFIRPDFAWSAGHWLVLAATLLWAAENAIAKRTLQSMPGTIVAWGRMSFGVLFMLPFLTASGKIGLITAMSSAQWAWIGITSALLFLYVFSFYNGLASVRLSTATAILTLGAPITALLQAAYFGTAIAPSQALGMLLLLAGVMLVAWLPMVRLDTAEWSA